MNTMQPSLSTASTFSLSPARRPCLPLWLKVAYTAFMAVLVPVYWHQYGLTNFLFFCDLALFLTLIGMWTEKPLYTSMAAAGILLPQALWCVDFAVEATGHHFTGMTSYMFDAKRSLFLRGLSFFHGWLPFLLIFAVKRLGYDQRGLKAWTGLAWAACVYSYFFLPKAGTVMPDPKIPVNINYVWGMSDTTPQTSMPSGLYLVVWMLVLFAVVYLPTHLILRKWKGLPQAKAE